MAFDEASLSHQCRRQSADPNPGPAADHFLSTATLHHWGNAQRLGQFPEFAGFLFEPRTADQAAALDVEVLGAAEEALAGLEPFTAEAIEQALRALAERIGQKPRQAFQPIRVAVTGSTVSPGLFESIELLGRDETLARIRDARSAAS